MQYKVYKMNLSDLEWQISVHMSFFYIMEFNAQLPVDIITSGHNKWHDWKYSGKRSGCIKRECTYTAIFIASVLAMWSYFALYT